MENKKTEKKRIFSKLTVCVAALALVSCAFVGGTFARYTTGQQTDNGGANVADWYIEVVRPGDGGSLEGWALISPYHVAWDESWTTGSRTNTIGEAKAVQITNKSESVSATVYIKVGDEMAYRAWNYQLDENTGELVRDANGDLVRTAVTLEVGKTYVDQDGRKYIWSEATDGEGDFYPCHLDENNAQTKDAHWVWYMDDIFEIGTPVSVGQPSETSDNPKYTNMVTLAPDSAVAITIPSATWTSDDVTVDSGNLGDYGDYRDTWIGENIISVGYTFTWEAVQASTAPNANGGSGGTPTPAP